MINLKKVTAVAAAAVFAASLGLTAQAADFAGKTVERVIPFKEGGGSDPHAPNLPPFG